MPTATTPNTFILTHDECEHEGDIDRDLSALRKSGLIFRMVYCTVALEAEQGASVVETRATLADVRAAINATESCICGSAAGGREEADSYVAEAAYDHAWDDLDGDEDWD